MFRKDEVFKIGWIYLCVMFFLQAILPAWTGIKNGLLDSAQLVVLFGCLFIALRQTTQEFPDWGGDQLSLWYALGLLFLELILQEFEWGRTLMLHEDGTMYQFSEMGLYGKMVEPLTALMFAVILFFFYRSKVWKYLEKVKLPLSSTGLTAIFVILSWVAEKQLIGNFSGNVAHELAGLGTYIMLLFLLSESITTAQGSGVKTVSAGKKGKHGNKYR